MYNVYVITKTKVIWSLDMRKEAENLTADIVGGGKKLGIPPHGYQRLERDKKSLSEKR